MPSNKRTLLPPTPLPQCSYLIETKQLDSVSVILLSGNSCHIRALLYGTDTVTPPSVGIKMTIASTVSLRLFVQLDKMETQQRRLMRVHLQSHCHQIVKRCSVPFCFLLSQASWLTLSFLEAKCSKHSLTCVVCAALLDMSFLFINRFIFTKLNTGMIQFSDCSFTQNTMLLLHQVHVWQGTKIVIVIRTYKTIQTFKFGRPCQYILFEKLKSN